jgi:hypothetical protein
MTLHRRLDCSLIGPVQAGEPGVKRIELMKVAMAACRRTRPTIGCPFPIIEASRSHWRQSIGLDALGKSSRGRREIIEHPVNPCPLPGLDRPSQALPCLLLGAPPSLPNKLLFFFSPSRRVTLFPLAPRCLAPQVADSCGPFLLGASDPAQPFRGTIATRASLVKP